MTAYDFESAIKRVFEAAGCRTQAELGDFLQVRQSSVSDAKRRKSIPAEWLVKLFEKKRISPTWVLYGEGGKHFVASDSRQTLPHVVRVTEVRPPKECSAQELFNELVRRALEKPDDEAIQKEVAASWLPIRKTDEKA